MRDYETIPQRRFFRNSNHAWIAGVCAGLADYFGFNLPATRVLTCISVMFLGPLTLVIYLGLVFLIPSDRHQPDRAARDPGFRRALRSDPSRTLTDVRRRFRSLDNRLARLERYVTSSRFKLDQEFRDL